MKTPVFVFHTHQICDSVGVGAGEAECCCDRLYLLSVFGSDCFLCYAHLACQVLGTPTKSARSGHDPRRAGRRNPAIRHSLSRLVRSCHVAARRIVYELGMRAIVRSAWIVTSNFCGRLARPRHIAHKGPPRETVPAVAMRCFKESLHTITRLAVTSVTTHVDRTVRF